jgi:hypothetical protein
MLYFSWNVARSKVVESTMVILEKTMFQSEPDPAEQSDLLDPPHRQIQIQANELVAQGKPGQAAPLFAKLAEVASANHPRRAANLHAQAAHAFADTQQGPAALIQAQAALRLFLKQKMIQRTPVFYANITRKLNHKGMKNIADALISEFGSRVAAIPVTPGFGGQKHGVVPTNCPKCGGPIHGERAKWVDLNTVECEYCGTLVRSE